MDWLIFWLAVAVLLGLVVLYDVTQRRHTILRIFPIVGHFRYILERVGPELRQYIVTDNNEERPFTRDHRRWIYASSKRQNNRFGFGSDNEMERSTNYLVIKHEAFPPMIDAEHSIENDSGQDHFLLPAAKIVGLPRGRKKAFRPESVVNISGMSFGSLSARAIQALNGGARLAQCMQTTGEGGISPHHLQGGNIVFQVGTGYFGCRDARGRFDLDVLEETIATAPVKAIEIKLSQGAKPGLGGILPGVKVTEEIARIRGVEAGKDCISPPAHSAFSDVDGLLELVESIADRTGLPVGIKSAVGKETFWRELADKMSDGGRGVDFITVDGGEGGTGAAPLAFTDHVSLPFKIGFTRVFSIFSEREMADKVTFIGSGRLGLPDAALMAFSLGCDMINVGREAMLAVGCIQSQRCHTGNCPTGVTTHKPWRTRGLDPDLKAVRTANYITQLRGELLALARTCGHHHPALVGAGQLELIDGRFGSRPLTEVFDYRADWGVPQVRQRREIEALMRDAAPQALGLD
ncbi:MAG: glutamate synthase-related protein [Solirubrobacterales bacterium]